MMVLPISMGQATILEIIREHPGKAYGAAIADILAAEYNKIVTPVHIYQTLYRMESRGLVEKAGSVKPSPKGASAKLYRLTGKGAEVLEMIIKIADLMKEDASHEGRRGI